VISGALSCALDGKSGGKLQARDKVSIDRLSRGGVVFADCAAGEVHHEEFIAQHRESQGKAHPCDEAGVNRGSGGSVVFANRGEVGKGVRHEEGVALDREPLGVVQPCDEAGANRGSGFGVIFVHDPTIVSRNLGDIKLCAGVFWHGPKRGDGDKEWVKGAQKRPPI
jgi:hypothetical protein